MTSSISATKANRLYWLGRYTERVYTCLHVVRKYLDDMIDKQTDCYKTYCSQLGISGGYGSAADFACDYLYNEDNVMSLASSLRFAFDNAIELRDDIKSESLSYIHLCQKVIKECAGRHAYVTELQHITDYLLAFWGSIDERMLDRRMKSLIRLGRLVESLDLHVRFGYDWDIISEIYRCGMADNAFMLQCVCDKGKTMELDGLFDGTRNLGEMDSERDNVIRCVNNLFAA